MLPKLPYRENKKTRQTAYFGGLNRTDLAKEGELTDCAGLTAERAPYLSPRYSDRIAHTFGVPHGMTAANGKLYVAADTDLWEFDGSVATETKKQFAFISGALCVFPDKKYYRPSAGESGSLERVETFTGFVLTDGALTRTDGVGFGFKVNDGVVLSGSGLAECNRVSAIVSEVDGGTLTFSTLRSDAIRTVRA